MPQETNKPMTGKERMEQRMKEMQEKQVQEQKNNHAIYTTAPTPLTWTVSMVISKYTSDKTAQYTLLDNKGVIIDMITESLSEPMVNWEEATPDAGKSESVKKYFAAHPEFTIVKKMN